MLYHAAPVGFDSSFEAASCFCEHDGKVLILLRSKHESQSLTWCLSGGGVDDGETPPMAVLRETWEETQITLPPDKLNFLRKVFVRLPTEEFVYNMFSVKFDKRPDVVIDAEHLEYKWAAPNEIMKMDNLIADFDKCLELYQAAKMQV